MGLAKTVRIWKCDACEHEAPWGDNWRSKLILHKKPVPWDETLVACSAECVESLECKGKKKTQQTEGGST